MTLEEIFNDMVERKLRYSIIAPSGSYLVIEIEGMVDGMSFKVSKSTHDSSKVVRLIVECYHQWVANAPKPLLTQVIEHRPEPLQIVSSSDDIPF